MFKIKESLSEDEVNKGLRNVIVDGLTTQAMVVLTSGVFLIAFGVKLGASNLVIGILASIPPLSQLIQIPATLLVEKYRKRRLISVVTAAASRLFLLLIAAIPFLFSNKKTGLIILFAGLVLHTTLAALSLCSWNSWMRDLVPQDRLSSVFSKRLAWGTGVGIVLFLLSSMFIDYWKKIHPEQELYGFSFLFILAFIVGMIGVLFLGKVPEPAMVQLTEKPKLFKLLLKPLKNTNFKNLIVFLGSWSFSVNLAAPFFAVYLLKRLNYDMSFIITLTVLGQIMSTVSLAGWGKFADRFSNKTVLKISTLMFYICILGWTFTTMPDKYWGTMPLLIILHIFMGLAIAGVTLAAGNIALKLAPREEATAYLATNIVINSIVAGLAPIIGGQFADFFSKRELSWTLKWISPTEEVALKTLDFQGWDFFFFISFLIGLYSLHRLSLVREVGEVPEKIVIREFLTSVRGNMRNLSTVGGIRQMIQISLTTFNQKRRIKKENNLRKKAEKKAVKAEKKNLPGNKE